MVDEQPNQDQPGSGEHPPQDPWLRDETSEFPHGDDDRTTALPPVGGPGATAVQPAAGRPGDEPAKWSARAGVPAGGPRRPVPQEQEQEWVPGEEPRAWWLPVLITLAVLVLLGLIGLGLWLVLHGQANPAPGPSASPSVTVSSAAPTSASPSPSDSPSPSVASVPVPPVSGVSVADAEALLTGSGLKFEIQKRVTDTQPPDTVIDCQPAVGALVAPGSTVILIVAEAPPASPSPSPSPSPSS